MYYVKTAKHIVKILSLPDSFITLVFLAMVGYDTIQEFNVDSKVECDQLNLAHGTKTNKTSAHLAKQ